MDDFGLEKTVDRLSQRIVIAAADAPTEGSMPASASRSVYLIDRYWLPLSLWWTSPMPFPGDLPPGSSLAVM